MKRFLLAFVLWTQAATGQSWSYQTFDNGHLIHAYAASGQGLTFRCNGPSRGGLDVLTAEAHEDRRTARGMMLIEIGPERIPLGNAFQRGDVVIWLSGTGYRLPPMVFNELDGVWQVELPSSDGFFAALRQSRDLILAPGQDRSWSFQTTGLTRAFEQATTLCTAAWTGQGPAYAITENALMRAARQHVIKGCSGNRFTELQNAFLSGPIDGDDVPDVVVTWDAIQCSGGFPRPFCGASHCSATVFLSSRSGARPDDLLVQAIKLVPLSTGRMGLSIVGRFDSCGPNSLGCEVIWFWNGSRLAELR